MECLKPLYLSKQDMVVPCGHCAFCGATRRSDWSLRLHYEGKLHYGSKFVTLTYANNNMKWDHGVPQLSKHDLQCFFKRLRKSGAKFKYYAVGEYGSKTYRPHYHILLFGDVSESLLRKAWSRQNRKTGTYYALGHVHIGTITQASICYCLGYIVNGRNWKMKHKRVGPFSVMSKGLGKNYLTPAMRAWHKPCKSFTEYRNYAMLDGQKRHLPRYYKVQIFSKVDLVRIAVRDQKDLFKRMVKWIRDPKRMRMRDPLAYRDLMYRRAAERIKFKSKENLTI